MGDAECTCTFGPTRHEYAVGRGYRYAVYLDDFDENVTFDSACPFHGEDGTMVAVVRLSGVGV